MPIEFRLLGPVEVLNDGEPLDLGSRKQRTILAVLIAHAGQRVDVDRCLQAGWGEDAPGGAVRSLQTYISNLRSIIDPDRAGFIQSLDGAYRLNLIGDSSVDWIEFERLAASDRFEDLEAAIDVWRGRPLQGVDDDWARSRVSSWEQTRLSALESWAGTKIEMGDTAQLAGDLEQICAQYPLHEPLWAYWMLALYRSGRQAKALDVFQTLRKRLAEDLGIEPSREIRDLEERILMQDETLDPIEGTPTNIPARVSEVVGRRKSLETLEQLLNNTRLLTISGTAGVGKTTVARELARSQLPRFKDGVWWFELASLRDGDLVLSEMLGSMRLPSSPPEDPGQVLRRHLRNSNSLLVFDNCEHLAEPVGRVVADLLASGRRLKVVATSREPLTIAGEVTMVLPPLELPPLDSTTLGEVMRTSAGELFAIRARQANPTYELSDETASRIGAICRRLDGIPFAIELAAARLRSMGLAELEGRLDDRFRLLTGGSRAEVPHHRTLIGTIDWSHELLSESEKELYSVLSVFEGGFEVDAVESVSGWDASFDALDSLVAHSLVEVGTRADATRYRMLETIRAHGQEKLEESARGEDVRNRHLNWVAELVRAGAYQLETDDAPRWISRFRAETDNIRAALSHAVENDPTTGAVICVGLSRFWFAYATDRVVTSLEDSTSFLEEGRRWCESMLDADSDRDIPMKTRARLLMALGGLLLLRLGQFGEALVRVRESRVLWEELEEVKGQAWAVFYEGTASFSMIPIEETIALFDRAQELHRKAGNRFGELVSTMLRGNSSAWGGALGQARRDFERFRLGAAELGSPWLLAHSDDNCAMLAVLDGEAPARAAELAMSAIRGFRPVANYACTCHTVHTAAMLMASLGDHRAAVRCLGIVESIRRRLGMVLPRYEDRTELVERVGLGTFDGASRHREHRIGRSLSPDDGIDWVLELLETVA